ncbi:hypothetical protein SAMN05421759_104188 [Roseivivax lentus]|uniref:Uracil DNA glycosylase superfamily protein n=1 Tax=Roseivivax lentus TaxID=633194 RepID=A0A1N7MCG2_9RHOB|nr:hypothetical protein [Roseivivax lentus]SIS83753.1 hypothetical protein SAMN05421759_104188 [Roseivivax lentus]
MNGRAAYPFQQALAARRAFRPAGFTTLDEIGLDLDLVSPYQLSCGNAEGPVLISYNHIDAPTARAHRDRIARDGYLPEMLFNRVLDRALAGTGMVRADIYLTHAFHALPATRSATIPERLVMESFERITRHEIKGRPVIALGQAAAKCCAAFEVPHRSVPHLSARGMSIEAKARLLAEALSETIARAA